MKKILVFIFSFLLFLVPSLLFGQTKSYKDSVKKYIYNNPIKTKEYTKKILRFARDNDIKEDIAFAYATFAVLHEVKGSLDSTLYYYSKGLSYVSDLKDILLYKSNIGRIYELDGNYKQALKWYTECLELAKANDDVETIHEMQIFIALVKNKLGNSKEALQLLEEVYVKSKIKKYVKQRFIVKDLIHVYLQQNMPEKAIPLIEEGLQQAYTDNNIEFQYFFHQQKAQVYISTNTTLALKNIKKALEKAKKIGNKEYINEANYILGLFYYETKSPNKTIELLQYILQTKIFKTSEQLTKYYKLIAKSYKRIDSIRKSNIYYEKYVKEKDKILEKNFSMLETIHELAIKEEADKIQAEKESRKKWISIAMILAIVCVAIYVLFFLKEKKNQKRFESLMLKIEAFEAKSQKREVVQPPIIVEKIIKETKEKETTEFLDTETVKEVVQETIVEERIDKEEKIDKTDTSYSINDEKVEELVLKIQKLEDAKYFLRQDCTLHNMAKKLKTNTSYLSKIINTYMDKSFSTYINELRINYAILELKNNKRLRAYSVKGIAEEMGYKNSDSFTKYFKLATGITPSIYIKKIVAQVE